MRDPLLVAVAVWKVVGSGVLCVVVCFCCGLLCRVGCCRGCFGVVGERGVCAEEPFSEEPA